MNKYENGKVYVIRSDQTEKIYIGSTCSSLSRRFYSHKCQSQNKTSSQKIMIFGDAYIELLELYPCKSKIELNKREGELIREHKDVVVNRTIPCRSKQEYFIDNRERMLEKSKQYHINNKDLRRQNGKKHFENRKGETVECVCGVKYTFQNKTNHEKTKRHNNYSL